MAKAGVIPEFRPTLEEMKDFPAYIRHMEAMGAHEAGVAKVIPPPEYVARQAGYDGPEIDELQIKSPIQQLFTGRHGLFQVVNIERKTLPVSEFRMLANSKKHMPPPDCADDPAALERKYWKNITFNPPVYGADLPGTLTDKSQTVWNINKLQTILDTIEDTSGAQIMGVNTAYLYFGMWKASFCWHTEDMDLYSINYIHFGAPKTWYSIPPSHASRMEALAAQFFSGDHKECKQFLRHKMSMISPKVLHDNGIPCYKTVHRAGEFMITFPRGFHAGFNHGFNCAESTNFASERWIDFGKTAVPCRCKGDTVRISMDIFIKKYQPDQWQTPPPSDASESDDDDAKWEAAEAEALRRQAEIASKRSGKRRRVMTEEELAERERAREARRAERQKVRLAERARRREEKMRLREEQRKQKEEEKIRALREQLRINAERKLRQELEAEKQLNASLSVCENSCEKSLVCSACGVRGPAEILQKVEKNQDLFDNECMLSVETLDSPLTPGKSDMGKAEVTALPSANCSSSYPSPSRGSGPSTPPSAGTTDEATDNLAVARCSKCGAAVHRECYGLGSQDIRPGPWVCAPCYSGLGARRCCLCPNLGGALKPTTCGKWAHISCALWINETSFVGGASMQAVQGIDAIPKDRWKLRCTLCGLSGRSNGACVQCHRGSCYTAFHVTCAMRAIYGYQVGMRVADNGAVICEAFCSRHSTVTLPVREGSVKSETMELSRARFRVGDNVLARYGPSRHSAEYYHGVITKEIAGRKLQVKFSDGSEASALEEKYVTACDVDRRQDDLVEGMAVTVTWNDGKQYPGTFKRYVDATRYCVSFDDGYSATVSFTDVTDPTDTTVRRGATQIVGGPVEAADLAQVEPTGRRKRKITNYKQLLNG